MAGKIDKILKELYARGISSELESRIKFELESGKSQKPATAPQIPASLYAKTDMDILPGYFKPLQNIQTSLKTLEELLDKDKKREEDGFPRRIRLGRLIKPNRDKKEQIIVVPTTTEPKFYHDDSITEDNEDSTGGSGDGEVGDVIGEQPAQPQQEEGEGQGAGQGEGTEHDISQEAFDLGKMLTEKFELPNLKMKGKKRSFSKYTYDLTDRHRGFGQILEKKETLKRIIETNILLGKIDPDNINTEDLVINPQDEIYRILSKEKDYETQAVVFFIRDYSGSMQGAPTEAVTTQHLFIYSWLMYQYQNNVATRFILHDTDPKEVSDFYTYHRSQVAGGTKVSPSIALVNKIVDEEKLEIENNIYIFYGTDGDDWDEDGKSTIEEVKKAFRYTNRIGITVARNAWGGSSGSTTVENYITNSGLLRDKPDLIRLDAFAAENASEARIIEGIRKLVG